MQLKIIKRPVTLFMAFVFTIFFFTGCSSIKANSNHFIQQESLNNLSVDDLSAADKNGVFKSNAEDYAVLGQMELVLSNQYLELYLGKLYDVAVKDKETGKIFFSNRAIYDSNINSNLNDDKKTMAYSQVRIEYYDSTENKIIKTSYPDCINDDKTKNQIAVKKDADKVTVTYDFGIKNENDKYCPAFSADTFKKLSDKASELESQGKLDMVDFARFEGCYIPIDYTQLSDDEKKSYKKLYANIQNIGQIYKLDSQVSDVQKLLLQKVLNALEFDTKAISEEMKKLGASKNKAVSSAFFEIPIVYSMDGRDLIATVDTSKIEKADDYYLTRISLLGSFGEAVAGQKNFMFIPDGSGAIIDGSVRNMDPSSLDLPFYGNDFAKKINNAEELNPYMSFPVFGIHTENTAVFSVVENGAGNGGITVQTPTTDYPFHSIEPWFSYNIQDKENNIGDSAASYNYIYSSIILKDSYQIRYHFLYGDNSTYSGMARYYQKYLQKKGVLRNKIDNENLFLNVNFLGAISKKKLVLGIPSDVLVAASKFSNIQSFSESLVNKNIGNFNIVCQGAINGGMDFKIPASIKIEDVLGGEKQFNKLASYVNTHNGKASLSIDFAKVYEKGNGLDINKQISRFVNKDFAYLANYFPSDLSEDDSRIAYIISPVYYQSIIKKFVNSYNIKNNKYITVETVGEYLSGNYSLSSGNSREESKLYTEQALKQLQDSGFSMTITGLNDYTLKYADYINELPLGCSDYNIESYSVPFAAMVLHGYVSYTGPVLNQQGNYKKVLLQNIESGAGLNYLLMTENPMLIQETKFSDMYSLSAKSLSSEIISKYHELNKIFKDLSKCTIVENERVQSNVYKTKYSNGTSIIVNYNNFDVNVNNTSVNGMSYKVVR